MKCAVTRDCKFIKSKSGTPYFVVGTLGGVGLTVGFEAPAEGLGLGGVVGAGVTLMAVT